MSTDTVIYVAKTMAGLEEVLAHELKELGATDIRVLQRAVEFKSDLKTLYKANLWSRTALRILKPIKDFVAHNEQVLYKRIRRIDWSEILDIDQTFKINCVAHSSIYTHSLYLSQKIKDAIVDQFREQYGRRPSVDTQNPDVVIDIYCHEKDFTISIDSSGQSLHRRGYRQSERAAPLNEVLAAGLVLLSGWDTRTPLYDPMCGSGTIIAEAYMIARGMAPRLRWEDFGFMRWTDYDRLIWDSVKTEAQAAIRPLGTELIGTDIDPQQARETKQLFRHLNWHEVNIDIRDFIGSTPPASSGTLIINPPYGERLMPDDDINLLHKNIGDTFKQQYRGWTAWIFSGNIAAMKNVGLRTSKKLQLFNGSIPCKYHKYELY